MTTCKPEDGTRPCDCNHNKGTCHCSDSDCGWEPDPVFCTCTVACIPEVERACRERESCR